MQRSAEQIFVIFQRLHPKDEIEGRGIVWRFVKKSWTSTMVSSLPKVKKIKGLVFI